MMMTTFYLMVTLLILLVVPDAHSQSAESRCRIQYDKETCYSFYTTLTDNLISNPRNIYELQQAYYPMGRFTSKVLLNIKYNVHLEGAFNGIHCEGTRVSEILNSSAYFYIGWSSSEMFNILSPLQLSELQLQISNSIYGLFIIPGSGMPLANTFGWKLKNSTGQAIDLERINLIEIDLKLSESNSQELCVPDEQLMMSVLQEVTIMLKVWASTSGETPEEINEDNLGFVTQAGFRVIANSHVHLTFEPFFAALVAVVCSIFGISSIVIAGFTFPRAYAYFSGDRKQFRYYFFALAMSLFMLNILIVAMELAKVDPSCDNIHYDYISDREKAGCSGVLITKLTYFATSAILSIIAAVVSSKDCETLLKMRCVRHNKGVQRFTYILCCWSIIFFLSLVVWAIAPTLLMTIVYPHIFLPLTVVMLASVFWLSVMLTIPQLFFHNIRMNIKCIDTLLFMLPFFGLIVLIFMIGIITVIYVNSVLFGSDIGGPLGLALATIPPIALTFFSEFYRDWFLTRTTDSNLVNDRDSKFATESMSALQSSTSSSMSSSGSGGGMNHQMSDSVFTIETNESVISPSEALDDQSNKDTRSTDNGTINNGSLHSQTMWKRRKAVRAKRPSRIISTGEAPGFLHRRLNYITNTKPSQRPARATRRPRPRVNSTPQSALSTLVESSANTAGNAATSTKPPQAS